MSRTHHARLAAVSLLLLGTACAEGNDPIAPSGASAATINADVASATGVAIASDLAVWAGNEAAVSAGFARDGAPDAGTCTRSGSTVTCTGGREGTLTVRRTVEHFDAAGAPQQQYDAATTARILFGAQVSGTATRDQVTSTVERTRRLSVTGLAGAETQRTWNGTGTANVLTTFTGTDMTREHRMIEADTTTNVVWVVAPRAQFPASGTVVRHVAVSTRITGTRSGSFSTVRRVRVTFNGTGLVPLEVSTVARNGTTVALTCQLDLATRTVACNDALPR